MRNLLIAAPLSNGCKPECLWFTGCGDVIKVRGVQDSEIAKRACVHAIRGVLAIVMSFDSAAAVGARDRHTYTWLAKICVSAGPVFPPMPGSRNSRKVFFGNAHDEGVHIRLRHMRIQVQSVF